MKVYLQASDGNYEDGYMTAGPEDRHNRFCMTRDINTGKCCVKCVFQGPFWYIEYLNPVEIRDDGGGRLVPVHYRKPGGESLWKFKQVPKNTKEASPICNAM